MIKNNSLNKYNSLIKFIRKIYKTKSKIQLHPPYLNGNEKKYLNSAIDSNFVSTSGEFISKFEDSYQHNIGDGGHKLSVGQKQRISIARAVMKNPPILILDEATSALDSESEQLVQDALTKLMANRTSLVIAHRLSTIQNADEIVVINEGEIVEQGTHDVLLKNKAHYHKLHNMQNLST